MNKKIQLRVMNNKVFFISTLIMFIAFGLLGYFLYNYIYSATNITFLVIFLSCLIGWVYMSFLEKGTKLITFEFTKNSINLYEGDEKINSLLFSQIKNYNIYYIIFKKKKKREYIIRILSDKNYYYWICPKNFHNKQESDDEDHIKMYKILNGLSLVKKITWRDQILLFLRPLVWIIAILSILILLGIFIWLIFFL
ncbi:hypothetical protein ETU09_01820 [Apibacter muscae]|uniref:Uncharacterized protein n=1 Tax=Apibacter muscae TaxID=2509004 RepID=A0A563DHV2_9FLAO|nr:hypothetical protein [Apibacter muscae]TWP29740.1 hypothetical protein ETU09_01820 [Apibacter muscae]